MRRRRVTILARPRVQENWKTPDYHRTINQTVALATKKQLVKMQTLILTKRERLRPIQRTVALRAAVTACVLLFFSWHLVMGQIPRKPELYRYRAVNRELTEALRAFAQDQRLNIVLDEKIESQTISEEVEMPPKDFLNYLTGKYGLVWYYDGTSIYIYRSDSLATRVFSLTSTTPSRMIETMKSLKLYSDRFPFRVLEDDGVVLAVGPPRMLEMTEFVIRTLELRNQKTAANELTIAVFPLRFASATDQTLEFQSSSVVIPGVATTLQAIVSGDETSSTLSTLLPRNRNGLSGYGLNRFSQTPTNTHPVKRNPDPSTEHPIENPPNHANEQADEESPLPTANGQQPKPSIQADQRLNAVIVKDLPSRMETYRKVIESLDQPTGLVEITAKIIDVTKSTLR